MFGWRGRSDDLRPFLFRSRGYLWNMRRAMRDGAEGSVMKQFGVAAAFALIVAAGAFSVAARAADAPPASGAPSRVSTDAAPGSEEVIIAPNAKRATPPDGDPRSVGERREQRTAFDKCVLRAKEPDSFDPVSSTPEEMCAKRLGMENRDSVPVSVRNQK
jgi:hypothetical protein